VHLNCTCLRGCYGPIDQAHIKSRGSGGCDDSWNVIPLCRKHHSEQHQIGWYRFAFKYIEVKLKLCELGWKYDYELGKMWNPRLQR